MSDPRRPPVQPPRNPARHDVGEDPGAAVCAAIALRLIDGEQAADDAALASHLRSCLGCFRTAGEIRDLPQIAALLRQDQDGARDPGEAFWAQLPVTASAAWARRQGGPARAAADGAAAPAATAERAARIPARSVVLSWFGWLRLPVPAALAGATVAVVMLALLRSGTPAVDRGPELGGSASAPAGHDADRARAETLTDDEVTAPGVLEDLDDDSPWDLLEAADLKTAVAQRGAQAGRSGGFVDDGLELGSSPAEQVESLDADELPAVAQALRARSRI